MRLGVWARAGTISCAALHLPAPEPELLEAAFAVSDELDRVPYTYALRTVTGHGDSLVLLSKVAVMPEQRTYAAVSGYGNYSAGACLRCVATRRAARGTVSKPFSGMVR